MVNDQETQEKKEQEQKQQAKKMNPSYDPWKDMRDIYIARRSRGEQPTILVSVNSRNYAVPKDQWVKVPYPVYEVVQNMLDQRKHTEMATERVMTPSNGK